MIEIYEHVHRSLKLELKRNRDSLIQSLYFIDVIIETIKPRDKEGHTWLRHELGSHFPVVSFQSQRSSTTFSPIFIVLVKNKQKTNAEPKFSLETSCKATQTCLGLSGKS